MNIYYTIFYVNTALIIILVLIKSILFFARTPFHSLLAWGYFSKYSIYTSRSPKVIKAKRTQNALSIIILFLVILDLLLLAMMKLA